MQQFRQRLSLNRFKRSAMAGGAKVSAIFFLALTALVAQDLTNYLTPDVARVGTRLACRCGGCKETIGNCPMLRCDSADPMRRRIFDMQSKGMNDDSIVKNIVQEQGIVALAGQQPIAWIGWLMPPIALIAGFWVYSRFVRRNQAVPVPLTAQDHATLERFRSQIDSELGDGDK